MQENYLALGQRTLGTSFINGMGIFSNITGVLQNPFNHIDILISFIVGFMSMVAGIWFIFLIFIGGYSYMTAGGDKSAIEEARKKLTTGVIGLVVVISATFLAGFLGYLIGLNILSPGAAIRNLQP
ncbi:hypothetical protein A2685_02225 [Candidatus Woesebacteria bacterium RIFCSPHIGHO2_01_FULL_37_10]|uniref:Uncharacterized protein n=1 Tax=Candidatus Woesebacteria bacterium RIFCSPHIGHO2_01_FULL_37_10 TaxID=1802489 RepID=A0A1F7XY63_9BACT|nr:MAG: hypothetical protein A2685_02225 [Candidatus Woesebacteria bacterium RIFCSPHIGHO2_01_FULL_37_10]